MSLPTPDRSVIRFEASLGVTSSYIHSAKTVSGTISTNILTVSGSIDTDSIRVGQRIKVGVSGHTYTITNIVSTELSVTPSLVATYTGAGLQIETVSSLTGFAGYQETAVQAAESDRPCFLDNFQNGLDSIEFCGGSQRLSVSNYGQLDDIFVGGGTISFLVTVKDDGGNNAGRLCEKLNSSNAIAWNLVTVGAGGGFCKLLFNHTTTGTTATFETTAFVVKLNEPQLINLYYNSSTPEVEPIVHIIGKEVGITTTSIPTGTAISDSGGTLNIGNRADGTRGFNGRLHGMFAWKRELDAFHRIRFEKYLAERWGMTLYFRKEGMELYYLARMYFGAEPDVPENKGLMIFLHGGGGSAEGLANGLAVRPIVGNDFHYCFLDGTKDQNGGRTWNSNDPLPTFNNAPDSRYISDFVKYKLAQGVINPNKVFLWGHSNGAMMAYRLAIEHPELFAGVFTVAGCVMVENPGTYTGKVKGLHGGLDTNVPLAGGLTTGPSGFTYPPTAPTISKFTNANGGNGVTIGNQLSDDYIILPNADHDLLSVNQNMISTFSGLTIVQCFYNWAMAN